MGTMNDIRLKLESGSTASQLIKEGYAKSSVNHAAKKLKKTEPVGNSKPLVDDELQQLRHQREVVKLRKEIAELEDSKEKVPDRLDKLEAEVLRLSKEIPTMTWNCYVSLYTFILRNNGWDEDAARQEAIRFTDEFLKHYGY